MLDAYVIEEIKRRDREKGRDDRPSVELPVPPPPPDRSPERGDDDRTNDRGVVIIDYSSGSSDDPGVVVIDYSR